METELEDVWVCPNCGAKMQRSSNSSIPIYVCPECGCSIEDTEQNFDSNAICPNCHHVLDDNNECSHCGYDLGSDFD
ncbi:MAG: hypothetical protein DRN05_05910 [Thermoplasmata archaeon]|nr:MAG: hypothetical protein DRN05_05910 [Thermoplasmata archaeon]